MGDSRAETSQIGRRLRDSAPGRTVLIETFVETTPPRPCDAAGPLDKMSGSTLGPRDPGCAIEAIAGGRESEKRRRPCTRAATLHRSDRLLMRCVEGLAISSGALASASGCRPQSTSYISPAPARPSSSDSDRTRFFWSTCADRDPRGSRAVPPRPCDATGLLDEMSGSTRGPREPGGAVESVAGPREREAGEAAHQGATPLRPDWLPIRCVQGLAIFLETLASASGCRPQSTSVPHRDDRTVTGDRGDRDGRKAAQRVTRMGHETGNNTDRVPITSM